MSNASKEETLNNVCGSLLYVSTYKSETVASPSVHAIAGERSQLIIGVGIVEVAGKYELAKSVVIKFVCRNLL